MKSYVAVSPNIQSPKLFNKFSWNVVLSLYIKIIGKYILVSMGWNIILNSEVHVIFSDYGLCFDPGDAGNIFKQNVGIHLQDYTESYKHKHFPPQTTAIS
jgi:hypothetical protein